MTPAAFDSLWIVDRDQSRVRALWLESTHLGLNTRFVDRSIDRDGFVAWMLEATFPGAAFAAPGGGWLVSLTRFGRREDGDSAFGLLRVDELGRRLWEIENSPRLVAVDPETGVLFFEEQSGLQPNRFDRAMLRN